MKVKDIFAYPVEREITSVIKVDDLSLEEVAQELEEYVVTEAIEDSLLEFLDAYNSTRFQSTEKIGVWISGFFGSGKSHFAKMIGHLLENRKIDGETAIDKFLVRIAGSSRASEIKRALHELNNNFNNLVVMFQIRAEAYGETEKITDIIYREFLKSRSLSTDFHIARMELELLKERKYEEFKRTIVDLCGKSWEETRKQYLFAEPYRVKALYKMFPKRYASEEQVEKVLEDIKDKFQLSPASLAEELLDYLQEEEGSNSEKTARLVFIVDEMGQFIAESNKQLLELQSIAEEFSSKGKGKLWLLVTSQEKLEEVIEGAGQRRPTFSKIIDRFDLPLQMTSEDIEKVLGQRILKKKETAISELDERFSSYQGNITDIATLQNTNRKLPECSKNSFERTYPFLPYQFSIMPWIFASVRSKGGPGMQLTGSERSMLGVTQGVLKSPLTEFKEADLDRLVTLDEIYDQIETEVPTEIRRTITGVESSLHYPDFPLSKILKALYLLQQLEWIPRDLENITRILANDITISVAHLEEKIKEGLSKLVEGKYVAVREGQYEFLSGAKKTIMEEVSSIEVREGDKKRKAKEFLKVILAKDRVLYENLRWFDIKVYGDDEEFSSKGDIELRVYSPIQVMKNPDLDKDIVLKESLASENSMKVYWLAKENGDAEQNITRIFQIEEVLNARGGKPKSDEEKEILRELATEKQRLEDSIQAQFKSSLLRGTLICDGSETEIEEKIKDIGTVIDNGITEVIPKIYPKFDMARFKTSEKSIREILQAPPNQLSEIESDVGLFDKGGQLNRHIAAVEEILSEIRSRADKGQSTLGKDIIGFFERTPYGWDPIFSRLIVTALFRDGAITLSYEGKTFRDFKKPEAQDLLVNSRKFNNTRLDYEEEDIELTLEDRQKVRGKLELLFGRKLSDDGVNTLSCALEEGLKEMEDEQKHLRIKCEGARLPLREEFNKTGEIIAPVLEHVKPRRRIREFMEVMAKIEEIHKYQVKVKEFTESEKIEEFKTLKGAKEKVENSLSYVEPAEKKRIAEHLTELNKIIDGRKLIESWGEFYENAQGVISLYCKAYNLLHQEVNRLYQELAEEVRTNPLYKGTPLESFISQIEAKTCDRDPKWGDDPITCENCRQSIEGLRLKIESLGRFKKELEDAIFAAISAKKPGGRRVAALSLKAVVKTRRIESEEQLDKALGEIREAVNERLKNNEIVTLE